MIRCGPFLELYLAGVYALRIGCTIVPSTSRQSQVVKSSHALGRATVRRL